jgi:hypothetical protein
MGDLPREKNKKIFQDGLIVIGDLPGLKYTKIFPKNSLIVTGDQLTHTHPGLISRATCPYTLILVYFHK